jgi:hypothetical protein
MGPVLIYDLPSIYASVKAKVVFFIDLIVGRVVSIRVFAAAPQRMGDRCVRQISAYQDPLRRFP